MTLKSLLDNGLGLEMTKKQAQDIEEHEKLAKTLEDHTVKAASRKVENKMVRVTRFTLFNLLVFRRFKQPLTFYVLPKQECAIKCTFLVSIKFSKSVRTSVFKHDRNSFATICNSPVD